MNTFQTAIKQSAQQSGRKKYKLVTTWQTKNPPQKGNRYGNKNKSNIQNPPKSQ
jgi:hypothetical protein